MVGIDVVDVKRIEKTDFEAFLQKVFCESEKNYILQKKNKYETAAGIFAVKEAVVKALGTGFVGKISFQDIEVFHDTFGAPYVELKNEAKNILDSKGNIIFVSLSHDGGIAVAMAAIR